MPGAHVHLHRPCQSPIDDLERRIAKEDPPHVIFRLVCSFFTGPSTVTRSSLRMLRRVAVFCPPPPPPARELAFIRSHPPPTSVLHSARQMWW